MEQYLDGLVPPRSPELQTMEAYAAEKGFPIIGPASGQLCYLTARLMGAHSVFEMGSGYGYSTAWFARAEQENGGGVVHRVVRNEE
jgi:predicted O-methyltransferase YrrM